MPLETNPDLSQIPHHNWHLTAVIHEGRGGVDFPINKNEKKAFPVSIKIRRVIGQTITKAELHKFQAFQTPIVPTFATQTKLEQHQREVREESLLQLALQASPPDSTILLANNKRREIQAQEQKIILIPIKDKQECFYYIFIDKKSVSLNYVNGEIIEGSGVEYSIENKWSTQRQTDRSDRLIKQFYPHAVITETGETKQIYAMALIIKPGEEVQIANISSKTPMEIRLHEV